MTRHTKVHSTYSSTERREVGITHFHSHHGAELEFRSTLKVGYIGQQDRYDLPLLLSNNSSTHQLENDLGFSGTPHTSELGRFRYGRSLGIPSSMWRAG